MGRTKTAGKHRHDIPVWFNPALAAHVVSWFAIQAGGTIDRMHAMMLLYVTQRDCVERYGHLMVDDDIIVTTYGPTSTNVYDLVYARTDSLVWNIYLKPGPKRTIKIQDGISTDLLDELSVANITVLNAVWERFGALDTSQLYAWIRSNCPEWQPANADQSTIELQAIMEAVGFSDAEDAANEQLSYRGIARSFAEAAAL